MAGYQLELTEAPTQARRSNAHQRARAKIPQRFLELLAKGATVETVGFPRNYVSQIFLVEKKDRGQRPVINLKGLNQFVKTEHFKMEGLHLLPDLLQLQD